MKLIKKNNLYSHVKKTLKIEYKTKKNICIHIFKNISTYSCFFKVLILYIYLKEIIFIRGLI